MYSKILFAVDEDESLEAAIRVLAAYARPIGSAVHVVNVRHIDGGALEPDARRLVPAVIERLHEAGVDAAGGELRLVHRGGDIGAVVAAVATEIGAELVAVGSHGRSDLGAVLMGSVSRRAATGLAIPVLVLRAPVTLAGTPRRVLVAVDGSPGSDQAVDEAGSIAEQFGASVLVLHVRQIVAAEGVAFVEPEPEGQAILGRAVGALEARGIEAGGETVVHHTIAAGIADTAERIDADLVVLGSRRPSAFGELVGGSVAHSVVHRLRRPVLLARRVGVPEPVR